MKRTLALFLLLTLSVASACGGSHPTADGGQQDARVLLPDASVVIPRDAGTTPVSPPPTVTGVSPATGSETGKTRVTIRGTSFVEPAQVFFDGIPATGVVALDEIAIAATTPPHAPGEVTVKVVTPGGSAELPRGFRYHRELTLLGFEPQRIPDRGGVHVRVAGRGFDADTIVLLDRKPLLGARLVDPEHIEGFSPALSPGRPEIRAFHRDAEARRTDLVVVFGTPRLRAIAPGYGPIFGARRQDLSGAGLENAQTVRFGSRAGVDLTLSSGVRLSVAPPLLAAGIYTVTVENPDASGAIEGGYVAYDPAEATFGVVGVAPGTASTAGGEIATIVGNGFTPDDIVFIGGLPARVMRVVSANAITVVVPGGLPVGRYQVKVIAMMTGRSAAANDAVRIYAPITVASVTPASGPIGGGTAVSITGTGFTSDVEVRIGAARLADVVVRSSTEIAGTTVAGAHGPQDVVVESPDTRGVLAGGFSYEEPFDLIRIDPVEGSIAGNTYVSLLGRGFSAPVSVKFGANPGAGAVLENGSVLGVRTAPAQPGRVDLDVSIGGQVLTIRNGYSFYDPRLITGGAWGGPIEGSVNVAVMSIVNGQRVNVQGAVVQLGYDANPRYTRVTDMNGLATISGPELRGAQTVTVGQNELEHVTFTEVNARNLTMFASAFPRSAPPDAPISPCQMGGMPPVVKGKVFKFKSSLDPVTRPGFRPVARVTYTQPNVFTANPPMPASQVAFVTADGGEFTITVMRVGTVAVYAILGDFNTATQQFIPRRMGIARQVPVGVGTVTENINVSLDFELDRSLLVRMADPPRQVPGPSINAVFPFLNLNSEGVIPFPATALASREIILPNLPAIAASQFFYMGGSFTADANGGLTNPWSITLLESGQPFNQGLDLGPFLQMPQNAEPKPGRVISRGAISWDQGGVTPDLTTVEVVDVRTVGGCCCIDLNMNGRCEPAEPRQCGALPQQFTRWNIFGQGGLASYVMPRMPSGINALEYPNSCNRETSVYCPTYPYIVQQAIAPRFSYDEFNYNQFSPFFWSSWSVWISNFTSKEETE